VRVEGDLTAVRIDKGTGAFETMGTATPPVGRGWEYFTSGYPFARHAEEIPRLLEEKMASPSVTPGRYDLVIDPSNLWLTIHESIGHATELDRVLGYEANYAGTSFATLDKLNTLQYGAPCMHVTGDREVPHGLATVAYDDEGVGAQTWDIIRDGVLVGYQLNRQMAHKRGFGRSNGCAFADAPGHVPLQRMPNVSLQPNPQDVSLDALIGGVDDGIYVVGDKSWSIDMQRYNFQFTGQKFFRIHNGRLAGQLKDVAYQSRTTDFWNALETLGGRSTFVLGGAFNCGKGQPGQIAPVSHGCPAALFRGISILNTAQEGR
jgi:TldD protein